MFSKYLIVSVNAETKENIRRIKNTKKKKERTGRIATKSKEPLAQFCLLRFVSDPNAQTNNITNPTNGIAVINSVITHSFILMTLVSSSLL